MELLPPVNKIWVWSSVLKRIPRYNTLVMLAPGHTSKQRSDGLELYFNVTICIGNTLISVNRMQSRSTYPIQSWPETWYMVYNLKKNNNKKQTAICFISICYKCIKKKSSIKCCWRQQNLEKYTFGLPQESNTYCTVKVYKIGAKHCCDVTRPVLRVQ